jgi:hypothetical protein
VLADVGARLRAEIRVDADPADDGVDSGHGRSALSEKDS